MWEGIKTVYEGLLLERYSSENLNFLKAEFHDEHKKIKGSIVPIGSLLMDTYFLSRLFRIYKNNPTHRDSSIVITFTGDAHTNTYINFFKKYLGVKFNKYKSTGPYDKCIDVDIKYFK